MPLFNQEIRSKQSTRTKIGRVVRSEGGYVDVIAVGGNTVIQKVKTGGLSPNVGDYVTIVFHSDGEKQAVPISSKEQVTSSSSVMASGSSSGGGAFTAGNGLSTTVGGVTNVNVVSGRTQITSNAVDVNTSLLPTPLVGEIGRVAYVSATGQLSYSSILSLNGVQVVISGTSARIMGDFSNGTRANRTLFQSSSTNAATNVGTIPNGSGTSAGFTAFGSSDPDNSKGIQITGTSTEAFVNSFQATSGTLSALALLFKINAAEAARFTSNKAFLVGKTSQALADSIGNVEINDSLWIGNLLKIAGATGGLATLQAPATVTPTLTLPSSTGTLALTSNITSAISGTTGTISKFTSANVIGDSIITESSSQIGINGTLKLGSGYPRTGAIFDVIGSATASIGSPASGTIGFSYWGPYGNDQWNDGYAFQFDVWAYRTHNSTKIFSSTPLSLIGSDNGNSDSGYSIDLAWTAVEGADGYLVRVKQDDWYGATNDYYFEVPSNSAHISNAYVFDIAANYTYGTPSTSTTTTTGTGDFYLTRVGDLYSAKKFFFANLPTVSALSSSNGISVYGNPNYTISLLPLARVHLGGISLNPSVDALLSQLIFPTGASGSSSPGIRMVGGATVGGLSMDSSGILEFWNNFSAYVDTPVAGRLQAAFRIDTRSGYEVEGFVVGGSTTGGTGFVGLGIDFVYGDVNLAYYGIGSVGLCVDTNTAGIRGTNGNVAIGKTLYVGENIKVNSSGGMKIGTATSQKLSFWNATPIVQPTTSVAASGFTANAGTAVNDASTFDGYTLKQVVKALRNTGLLA